MKRLARHPARGLGDPEFATAVRQERKGIEAFNGQGLRRLATGLDGAS